jgi:SAM-dependent methyltransferase
MEEIKKLLKEVLNREFIRAVISSPKEKEGTAVLLECGTEPVQGILKIKVRPLEKRGELMFQLEAFTKTQAFHRNLNPEAAGEILAVVMERFGQMQLETVSQDCTVLISKKGKVTIRRKQKKIRAKAEDLSHNRKKRYILEEGVKVPFLQDLGVMTQDGKIVHTRFDKFRQINRFLEFIEDILPQLDRGRELTILDFGCGKSYLTFAMYYYLHELKKYDIRIIGLDLKSEVIRHCNELAEKYGYEKLQFLEGDIADYEGVNHVDMVVTLHACNTATDYALAKAVGWNAKVILSVPCCQHEINEQFEAGETPEVLAAVMEYGLLRERFAALVTDGLRAKYLESEGYETQVLEFIDMEHTPKNILLRAVRRGKTDGAIEAESRKKLEECEAFLNIQPTLGRLLSEKSRHR